jgi:hypothetical protein
MYVDELEKLYQREKVICANMENKARTLQFGDTGQGETIENGELQGH